MKHTFKVLLLGLLATAVLSTSAFAEWVYVTKNGKKYHDENSRFAKMEGAMRLSKEEAEKQGFEPAKDYLQAVEREASETKPTKK